jgi:sugar phosphate isomerase/epimerase
MQIGIFLKVFPRPTLEESLDAVQNLGLHAVQFNFTSAGLASMPEAIDPGLCDRIREAMAVRAIAMSAVSGTFNTCHPDIERRRDGLRRLGVLAAACQRLGTSIVTISTGTRDPEDVWRRHPDNDSPAAWQDTLTTVRHAVKIADDNGVVLAFEPEVANVVDSAVKARQLLDEVGSPHLKVLMDGANLFHAGKLARMAEVLDPAFELLGKDIVLAHAKDLSRDGEAGHEAAGKGALDYDRYLALLDAAGFKGPLVLHGLAESQVPESLAFVRGKLAQFAQAHLASGNSPAAVL